MQTTSRTRLGKEERGRAQTPGGGGDRYPDATVLSPLAKELVDHSWVRALSVRLGSVACDFQYFVIDGHHFWEVLINSVLLGETQSDTHPLRACMVWMRMTRRMPHTIWVASRDGRLKPPDKKHHPKVQPTRSGSVK